MFPRKIFTSVIHTCSSQRLRLQLPALTLHPVYAAVLEQFTFRGHNLKDDLGALSATSRDNDLTMNVSSGDATTASLDYTVSASASIGTHQFTVSNTWGESEPSNFTVGYPPAVIASVSPPIRRIYCATLKDDYRSADRALGVWILRMAANHRGYRQHKSGLGCCYFSGTCIRQFARQLQFQCSGLCYQ